MTQIHYEVTVDGTEHKDTFTPEDVSDPRAGWNPSVAKSYAQHLAVQKWGNGFDVNTVDVKIREDHTQYNETGGLSL